MLIAQAKRRLLYFIYYSLPPKRFYNEIINYSNIRKEKLLVNGVNNLLKTLGIRRRWKGIRMKISLLIVALRKHN